MTHTVPIVPLTAEAAAPYGWMLGKPLPTGKDAIAFSSPGSDFWHEHVFDTGLQGEAEVLWVNYRVADPVITKLEMHSLTQQAVIPLTGSIIQIVAQSDTNDAPDLATVQAFVLAPGVGICMKPGIWHATRVDGDDREATCLMLTRRSTTIDLVKHLAGGVSARETCLVEIPEIRLSR